jgi:hypothetical protein
LSERWRGRWPVLGSEENENEGVEIRHCRARDCIVRCLVRVSAGGPERYQTLSVQHVRFATIALLGLISGAVGVAGLVVGCATMMQETRLAVQNLAEEAQLAAHPVDSP